MAADPRAVVPYHDPHDSDYVALSDNILMDFSDESATTVDALLNPAPMANYPDINFDHLNPIGDPYVQEILDAFLNCPINDRAAGEGQIVQADNICNSTETKPPLMARNAPFSCSFCEVLGEIIHTDGNEAARLEIHGVLGTIQHAVLQLCAGPDSVPTWEFIDFCHRDAESATNLLEQYCEDRRLAGFALVEDLAPVSYSKMDAFENPAHQFPFDVGRCKVESCDQQQQHFVNAAVVNKTSLAIQRDRSSRMTLDDFVDYFHLPIEKAAKELGVCATVVKKICRKHGLGRWPHRKMKSLRRRLETLKRNLGDNRDRAGVQREIGGLLQQIDSIRSAASSAGNL